jgi:hypothetical protein
MQGMLALSRRGEGNMQYCAVLLLLLQQLLQAVSEFCCSTEQPGTHPVDVFIMQQCSKPLRLTCS